MRNRRSGVSGGFSGISLNVVAQMLDHPPADLLARFLGCCTSADENRQVVRHLLAQCPECAIRLQQLMRMRYPGHAYDEAFERFMAEARRWSAVAEASGSWQRRQLNLLSQL